MVVVDDLKPPALPTTRLSQTQLAHLSDIQQLFSSILKDNPSNTSLMEMSINTGDAVPFQSMPYRLPVAVVEPVRDALDVLLSANIVEPLTSPWSSPMLPVKKKNGSVSICIDFRLAELLVCTRPILNAPTRYYY